MLPPIAVTASAELDRKVRVEKERDIVAQPRTSHDHEQTTTAEERKPDEPVKQFRVSFTPKAKVKQNNGEEDIILSINSRLWELSVYI